MTSVTTFVRTSVGKKALIGLTGLLASLFTLTHMAGNLLILVGSEAYNKYSHALITNPFLPVAEIGLVVIFLTHIGLAIWVTCENRKARQVRYAMLSKEKGATFAARTMILSGLLILVFLILHLITFKYGTSYSVIYNGVEMRDLYRLVVEKFTQPLYVFWYLISLVVLGFHLSHGFAAVFQSMGFTSRINPVVKKTGYVFAVLIAAGFISQPIYIYFWGYLP